MSHTESYSRVNVIRVQMNMRCGYRVCLSLYESGIDVSAEEQEYTQLNNVMLYLLYEIFKFISRFS
jgi:hypothetical protein